MKYRKLPGTQQKVSEVGFDLSLLVKTQADSNLRYCKHLLGYALDRGFNFFDVSDFEAKGYGETLLGETFPSDRDRIVISTKFNCDGLQSFSSKNIIKGCEESLKRLRSDHIDLYQVHYPGLRGIQSDEIFEALQKLKKSGKILTWGAHLAPKSNDPEEAELLIRFRKANCLQMVCNLIEQEPGFSLFEMAEKFGTGFVVRSPHWDNISERYEDFETTGAKKLAQLKFLEKKELDLSKAAIKFLSAQAAVVSVLIGIQEEKQINHFAGICEAPDLSREEIRMARHLFENNFYLTPSILKSTEHG